jgi:hypothetical protein
MTVHKTIISETAKSSGNLLGGNLVLMVLVPDRSPLLGGKVRILSYHHLVDSLSKLNSRSVDAGLTRSILAGFELSKLLLAKGNNLCVILHRLSDTSEELGLGGLGGHSVFSFEHL